MITNNNRHGTTDRFCCDAVSMNVQICTRLTAAFPTRYSGVEPIPTSYLIHCKYQSDSVFIQIYCANSLICIIGTIFMIVIYDLYYYYDNNTRMMHGHDNVIPSTYIISGKE